MKFAFENQQQQELGQLNAIQFNQKFVELQQDVWQGKGDAVGRVFHEKQEGREGQKFESSPSGSQVNEA